MVGIIPGGAWFRSTSRSKVVEASAVKQPRPQNNFKTIAKRYAGHEDDIKGL